MISFRQYIRYSSNQYRANEWIKMAKKVFRPELVIDCLAVQGIRTVHSVAITSGCVHRPNEVRTRLDPIAVDKSCHELHSTLASDPLSTLWIVLLHVSWTSVSAVAAVSGVLYQENLRIPCEEGWKHSFGGGSLLWEIFYERNGCRLTWGGTGDQPTFVLIVALPPSKEK